MAELAGLTHATTAEGRRLADLNRTMMEGMDRLFASARSQFGAEGDAFAASMIAGAAVSGGIPDPDTASIIEESNDRVVYAMEGPVTSYAVVNIDGEWMVDGDYAAEQINAMGSLSDSALQMIEKLGDVINQVAAMIDNGQITSADQINTFMQKLSQSN